MIGWCCLIHNSLHINHFWPSHLIYQAGDLILKFNGSNITLCVLKFHIDLSHTWSDIQIYCKFLISSWYILDFEPWMKPQVSRFCIASHHELWTINNDEWLMYHLDNVEIQCKVIFVFSLRLCHCQKELGNGAPPGYLRCHPGGAAPC